MKIQQLKSVFLTSCLVGLVAAGTADASERRFVYSYEASPFTPGSFEYESWFTWKTDNDFDRIDFRHEFEWAPTERLQLGFYAADWSWQDGEGSSFHDVGLEAIYNLSNPTTDFLGSSIYGEIKGWDEFVELEGKLLLQKNIGPLALVYNLGIEADWEGSGLEEKSGELIQTLGLSYLVTPEFGVGGELLHEVGFHEWEESGPSVVYAGPNMTARFGSVWATLAGLWEVTGIDDEPDFQLRAIVGVHF